jgi:serine/threonine-protein kinase
MTVGEFTGNTFGNQYQIGDRLYSNGVIHFYQAYQISLNRTVTVQVLAPKYRVDPYWPRGFVNGAEIAAQYAHPNILPVFDHGLHDQIDYVVVRHTEGGSLKNKIEVSSLGLSECASIIRQIATALDYVHAQGSCHGDPATVNIALDGAGNAFIADFYLMGWLKATATLDTVAGVPAYMAPERMVGQPPTALTDQYALAGIAYNMLTGKLPWDSPARARLPETIVPPQTVRAEIPQLVNAVLLRAMAKDPAARFVTVTEFARQFEETLKGDIRHVFISYSRRDSEYVQQLKALAHVKDKCNEVD